MLQAWHGGSRWMGKPEVRAPRKGRYECGPGIYLSTRYLTARKYAGGSNVTTLVTLAEGVRWLQQAKLPLRELVQFLDKTPRLKNRRSIKEDFLQRAVKRGLELDDLAAVETLVNVLINTESLSGNVGLYLAEWLVSKGVDASLYSAFGQDQWVIVFNPAIIVQHKVVSATNAPLDLYELPKIELPGAAG
jgi:hypothetical protein